MHTEDAGTLTLDIDAAREPVSEAARKVLDNAAEKRAGREEVVGIKGLLIGKSDTYEVSPFHIFIQEGWNSRDFSTQENQDHVLSLAHSIAARGVEVPLTVFFNKEDGRLYLTDGESRLRATWHAINVLGAPILTVPVRMEPRGSNDETRVAGQLVKNSGKPLEKLEAACVVRRLLNFGWDDKRIAAEVGKTRGWVAQMVEVLELSGEMQGLVAAGTVSATEAVRVTKEHGDAAPALVEAAAKLTSANGGRKAGKATPAALRAVRSARDDIPERLTLPALLAILKKAEPVIETNGCTSLLISPEDWARIEAAF